MADPELEALRQQRLAQLQSQYKGTGDPEAENQKAEQLKAREDAKNSILSQILDQAARARLNTLMLCKPEKGRMVENYLLQMAQTGQICTKVTEEALIKLLENVSSRTQSKTSVKFDRRRAALDSDEDDL
ncbi:unnamed protein product [Callosobruchus maculatus]|uniref:Programmed cell death protein 5 n=1 Tax=Callosobruchus maculatus TaxID=64391 RepID=A0A653CDD8_CALMS|nr:unnamed protein product [Callosobruchus maculatus]